MAQVPFVDALTTILDPSLPLTVIEWEEWGDPLHDPEVYAYMKSYTPYENVEPARSYPPILAVTSLNDTRVLYGEPAKWIARLQADRGAAAPFLLKTEMVAGHGGRSGRYDAWHEEALVLAWIVMRPLARRPVIGRRQLTATNAAVPADFAPPWRWCTGMSQLIVTRRLSLSPCCGASAPRPATPGGSGRTIGLREVASAAAAEVSITVAATDVQSPQVRAAR